MGSLQPEAVRDGTRLRYVRCVNRFAKDEDAVIAAATYPDQFWTMPRSMGAGGQSASYLGPPNQP
jgi:hypothetical protein